MSGFVVAAICLAILAFLIFATKKPPVLLPDTKRGELDEHSPFHSLLILPDEKTMKKSMKIMLLAYSMSGKTHFIGSLFRLGFDSGFEGFTVRPKNFNEGGRIQEIVKAIEENKVLTTMGIKVTELVLKQGVNKMVDVDIADIEGQAVQPDERTKDTGDKIYKTAAEYDGFIILVDAPETEAQQNKANQELAQTVDFIHDVLNKKENVPVVLVLNKIDLLPGSEGLSAKITKLRRELDAKYSANPRQANRAKRTELGEMVSPLITPLIRTIPVYAVIKQFFLRLRGKRIPNKVFVCTNIGFDNVDGTQLNPYGTGAAFLWTIYANLRSQQQQDGITGQAEESIEKLLSDIRTQYTSGHAYFNDDEKFWSLRNIGYLYGNEDWED